MTSISRNRRLVRSVCASTMATLVLSSVGASVGAAPTPAIETPALSAPFAGLRVGSQGTDVKALQQALIDAGITVRGGADGIYGPATRRAVLDFQTARGLTATGEVDAATEAALATGGDSDDPGSSAALAVGARGPEVTSLQQRLMDSGVYVAGGADGVFGAATKRAVTQFQRWNGLQPTGTLNAATAKKLGLAGGATTPPASTPVPTPPAETNGHVGLARGARGALVKELQAALQATGLVVRGGADGVFGPATERALEVFQQANASDQTGVVSERDARLLGLGGASATPPPSANPYLGLKLGARGDAVRDTQRALIAAGVSLRGGADGAFGNATESALTGYQTALGIAADGTVNQATIDELGLGTSTAPTPMPTDVSTTPAPSSDNPYVGLAVGANGPLVRELQLALQRTGLVVRGGADGSFGNATRSALIAFQAVNGIAQNGIVTAKGASILGLGSGSVGITNPNADTGGSVQMERFPVQGLCFYGDTWHAARGGGRLHVGVDVIADEGNLLYAVVDGEVSKLYRDTPGALAGNGLRISQPNGTYFTYLHMASFAPGIEVGTKVRAGDVIGYVGNTGSSATPHLHFEIHPNGGAAINPYPLIKAMDDCRNRTPRDQSSFN